MGGFYFFLFLVATMVATMVTALACAAIRGEWATLTIATEQRLMLPLAVAVEQIRVVAAYRTLRSVAFTLRSVAVTIFIAVAFFDAFATDRPVD